MTEQTTQFVVMLGDARPRGVSYPQSVALLGEGITTGVPFYAVPMFLVVEGDDYNFTMKDELATVFASQAAAQAAIDNMPASFSIQEISIIPVG